MRYALVTGGCGQIGSWFVEKLVERGYRVVVLDPRPPYPEWADLIAGDEVIYRHGTSADVRQIFALAEEYFFDYIYDFGALLGSEELTSRLDSALMMNTIGARNVFELAKMQGSAVYHINIEFAGYGFTDGYSVTKEMALRTAIEYAKKYGVYIVSSYVHHVFCERQRLLPARKLLPTLISYAVVGRRFRIFGSGDKLMDMLYAPDFADLVIDLMESGRAKPVNEHIYDIGVGYGIRLEDLVKMVYEMVGDKPNYVVVEDVRKQSSNPYRVAKNDWVEILGRRRLRGFKEVGKQVIDEYLRRYEPEDFRLAVEVYEQRHRFGEVGV